MIKFKSLLVITMIMASVSVFANDDMTTNVGSPSAPATPAQGANTGAPAVTGMSGSSEMGNGAAKREPARRHHKRRHKRHRRHRR